MRTFHLRKPSPALVLSLVALTVALGGTSYAAFSLPKNSVGTKQLKNNAVTTKKIKNGTITGSKINFSKLGTVPSANHANTAGSAGSATSATNATNATNVDGMQLTSFTYAANNGSTKSVVLNNFDGLTLKASCTSGANNGLSVYGNSAATHATISWTTISRSGTKLAGGSAANDSYTSMTAGQDLAMMAPGGTTDTGNGPVDIGYAVGQIVYSLPGGGRVSVDWSYGNGVGGSACYWTGTVVGAPSGTTVAAPTAKSTGGPSQSDQALQRARG